ncbi:hypothetical protein V3C99_013039 [Haemonchus contortus]|uniref:Uncharacterized protein n=1 Tax=Haemonchus contortus TaxID=6289 RepID=A0A7I4Y1I4_HAECO|nr:unnamed protein product [Haemonchus contortus]
MENDQYEQLGPKSGLPPPPPPPDAPPPPINPPPPPPPPPPPNGEKHSKKIPVLPARTPGNIGQFALRPGDDVDLSSDRTGVNGSDEAKAKQSKSKDPTDVQSAEKEKGKSKTKHDASDLKPYSEPKMLKICHAITLALLVISFILMALTVVQFVDIFVWLPMLFGDQE